MTMTSREWTMRDGSRVFVEVSGQPAGEAPAVMLCDGIGCDGFVWKYLRPHFEPRFTVVHGHYRGHGKSPLPEDPERCDIETLAQDTVDILDAVGVPGAVYFGHSMGVQVVLEAGLLAPSRVNGMVLLCGRHGRPLDTFHDTRVPDWLFLRVQALVATAPELVSTLLRTLVPSRLGWWVSKLTEVDGELLSREDFLPYLDHLSNMDPVFFLRMLRHAAQHSTEERLPELQMPALVIGGEFDGFTPFWVSEVMAKTIPQGELQMIRGGSHTAPMEQRALTELLIDDFLQRHRLLRTPGGSESLRSAESPVASAR